MRLILSIFHITRRYRLCPSVSAKNRRRRGSTGVLCVGYKAGEGCWSTHEGQVVRDCPDRRDCLASSIRISGVCRIYNYLGDGDDDNNLIAPAFDSHALKIAQKSTLQPDTLLETADASPTVTTAT